MSPDDILSILQVAGSVEIDELEIDVKVEDWSITGSIRGLRIHVAENAKGAAADIVASSQGKAPAAGKRLAKGGAS